MYCVIIHKKIYPTVIDSTWECLHEAEKRCGYLNDLITLDELKSLTMYADIVYMEACSYTPHQLNSRQKPEWARY